MSLREEYAPTHEDSPSLKRWVLDAVHNVFEHYPTSSTVPGESLSGAEALANKHNDPRPDVDAVIYLHAA